MSQSGRGRPAAEASPRPAALVPKDVRGVRFRVGGDEFVLLSCDLSPARGLAAAPLGSLSASERCVAELVLEGRSNNEIAGLRSTSVRTVANQIAAVFRKLNVRSRRELHALARRP